jgi:CRP/FNR family transcriptional regulator
VIAHSLGKATVLPGSVILIIVLSELAIIPADTFQDWVRRYDLWREFVFELLSQRLSAVMAIVEKVAFRRMDTRLAALLSERGGSSGMLRMTHQQIAAELGSSREVISRILEDFSAQEMIEVSRGSIKILDRDALEALSAV